jgi:hypothetical protein
VAGLGVLLEARHGVIFHAVKVVIGLVVLLHMLGAVVMELAFGATPLGGLVARRLLATRPFAHGRGRRFLLVRTGFYANLVEIF